MTEGTLIPAKAASVKDQSDAIVVSFHSDWYSHIQARDFSIVIRKQTPKFRAFDWLYFHVNSPVSAICARAPILKTFRANLQEVLDLASAVNLTPAEIRDYFWKDSTVGCYRLGTIQIAPKAITTKELTSALIYRPPQSCVILSMRAKQVIDCLAQFTPAVCK